MRRILAQTRKELIQIVRDKRALGLALLLPVTQLILMGTAITLDVQDLPIAVQDLDDSPASHRFVDAFRQSITFHIVPFPVDQSPENAFTSNKARAALIIPSHFGHDLARGINTPVQMLIDASDSNTAKLVAGYASEVTAAWNASNGASTHAAPVQAAIRLWYNPGRSAKKFYGPGIFVLVLSLFPPLLATLAAAKEGEQKTILQVYVSSISAHEFLLGKILTFMIVAFCECLLLLTLLFTYFGLNFAGDPTPFIVATILYTFCTATFGTMIGSAIPNQAAAMQVIALTGFLLVFMLSGLIFPIQNIPIQIRWLSNFIWGRYYIDVVRDALLQGGGWPAMWWKIAVIGIIGSFFYLMVWRNMRRMQLTAQDDGEKLPLPAGKKKTIDPGDDYPGMPRLVRLLKLVGDLPADAAVTPDSTLYKGAIVDAVKHFQERHGLTADGRMGKDTLDQLNVPLSDRVTQLQLTLERWRWAPRAYTPPPILVNIPEFVLRGFGPNETIDLTMRVVVGRSFRTRTPVFAQDMSYLVFRPYWNVPGAIQRGEMVPHIKKDPDYLAKNQLEVVDPHGTVVSTGPVSDEQLAKLNSLALSVRQRPGPKNSLGLVIFMFPNEHNVYLHSTPAPELFSRDRRDFSHGCIRVEDPVKLATYILQGKGGWTEDKIGTAMKSGPDSQQVSLAQKRPVVIIYATAVVLPDGTVKFFQDIYGHDASLQKSLARGLPRTRGKAATSAAPAPHQRAQS